MSIYTEVNGINRMVKQIYTGVNGINREVNKGFAGVDGVKKGIFENAPKIETYYTIIKDAAPNEIQRVGDSFVFFVIGSVGFQSSTSIALCYHFVNPISITKGFSVSGNIDTDGIDIEPILFTCRCNENIIVQEHIPMDYASHPFSGAISQPCKEISELCFNFEAHGNRKTVILDPDENSILINGYPYTINIPLNCTENEVFYLERKTGLL